MGTRIDPSSIEETLAMAAARLAGKGLLTHGDVLSQRIPEQNKLVAVTINRNQDVPDSVVWQDLSGKPQGLHHASTPPGSMSGP